jgi:hypothetical protein
MRLFFRRHHAIGARERKPQAFVSDPAVRPEVAARR